MMFDHTYNIANEAMDRITMPSALLSCLLLFPLRGKESRQKQVVIGHRGRSAKNNTRDHASAAF
jgi:hypothetical protein